MKTTDNKIYVFLFSLFLSLGTGALILKIPSLSEVVASKGNINLLTYGITVVLFCIVYFFGCLLVSRTSTSGHRQNPASAFVVSLFLLAADFVFLFFMFKMEVNVYASFSSRYIWHNMPLLLVILCITVENLFFLFLMRRSTLNTPNFSMYLLYGILTLLTAYNFYTPAVFLRDEADRLHMDAYFNSIYNVLHENAYSTYTTSIYGHYGIFYKLPLKLMGGDFIDFIFLNSCIGALCFLAMFLALHFMVRRTSLRILGAIAMTFPVLSMRSGIYWQLWPHRILFMSLMLCYAAFCVRYHKLNRMTCILGYLIAMAGVLWNTESGLFCAVAWSGFWILKILADHSRSFVNSFINICLHLAGIVFSFLGAYGIVEIYNISCGGSPAGLREFLFPLLQSSYMDDLLRVDLPDFPSAYLAVIGLLFLALAWGISKIRFIHSAFASDNALLPACYSFSASVLTLGQLTYFINRAAYHNLEICHLPAVLLICILAERGWEFVCTFHITDLRKYQTHMIYKGAFTITSIVILVSLCTGNIIQYGSNMSLRQQLHNKTEVHDFAANVAANIPENTYGFGIGVPEIYAMLRWDTQCYTLDFADLSLRPEVGDHVMEDIRKKNLSCFLAGENAVKRLQKYCSKDKSDWLLSNYQVAQTFEFQGAVLEYYIRK